MFIFTFPFCNLPHRASQAVQLLTAQPTEPNIGGTDTKEGHGAQGHQRMTKLPLMKADTQPTPSQPMCAEVRRVNEANAATNTMRPFLSFISYRKNILNPNGLNGCLTVHRRN